MLKNSYKIALVLKIKQSYCFILHYAGADPGGLFGLDDKPPSETRKDALRKII